MRTLILGLLWVIASGVVGQTQDDAGRVVRSDAEWRRLLTREQYHILRERGTEPAFKNKYWNNHEKGLYACAGCGRDLFSSEAKFDSGTGWPSFYQPIKDKFISKLRDDSYGLQRVEVRCTRCGGHLGHVFTDGPKPTGLRYCINSAALTFKKE
jgi:peptide-methionine (R)-S-oxide reductase